MGDKTAAHRIDLCIDDSSITDLRRRLSQARFPDEVNDNDWSYGTSLGYLKTLVSYWEENYDWRALERRVNQYDNLVFNVDGIDVHMLHAPSKHKDAQPLILFHGWPGCFLEFLEVIEPLRNPEAFGGSPDDAFHVVVPSLIGYGLSGKAVEPGMNTHRMATLFKEAVARLGYTSYLAQGGDYGSMVTRELAHLDPDNCRAVHVNMLLLSNFTDSSALADAPAAVQDAMKKFLLKEMGYYYIQASKPQTLGYGLNDSPIGVAAWLVEKYRSWSDCRGDLANSYSMDQLLDIFSLYWFTESITSSCRHYYEETWSDSNFGGAKQPFGFTHYPGESAPPPERADAEVLYPNTVYWNTVERGGHFAAFEVPDVFVTDMRQFRRAVDQYYQSR